MNLSRNTLSDTIQLKYLEYDRCSGFAHIVPTTILLDTKARSNDWAYLLYLQAERAGFEPAAGFTLHTLSRRGPSATRPPLQNNLVFIFKI